MIHKNRNSLFLTISSIFLGILVSLAGCENYNEPVQNYSVTTGVFVVCQGNFTYDNASLSFYNSSSKQVFNNIYASANNNKILGDVAQSMIIQDSLGMIVLNNSGKISVISTKTFQLKYTMGGFVSPRYIQIINPNKAYVSDLYDTYITIIDPQNFTITGKISVHKTTEQMVLFGNYVFATNWSDENSVQRIDCTKDSLEGMVQVTFEPNSMVLDKNNKIWVLSDGGYQRESNRQIAALTRIDATSFTVEATYSFPSLEYSPTCLTMNNTHDTLYFLSGGWQSSASALNGIFRMSIDATELPSQPFIYQGLKLFYGLGIDPQTSQIYVANAVDFSQDGWVYRYQPNAAPIDSFKCGVIPSWFCFKQQ